MLRFCTAMLLMLLSGHLQAATYAEFMSLLADIRDGELSAANEEHFRSMLFPDQITHDAQEFVKGASAKTMQSSELYFVVPSMDVLYEFLHDGLNSMIERRDEHLADKGGRGRLYAWYWGHWGRAAVNFYEVSGEQRFLDLIVNTYRRLLAERDDTLNLVDDERGWIVPAWGTLYKDGTRSNEITTAGLITLPICHFLNLADRNELVRQNYADAIRDFREAALETLSAFEDEIRQSPAGGGSFFFHLTDGIVEPLNHSHMFGAAVAHCAASIPREEFSRIVRGLAGYFSKAIVRNNNGSYSWPMHPLQPT